MIPDPIPLFGGLSFTFYGLFIAIGILACFFVLYFYTSKKGVPASVKDFVFFTAIISIAIGFLFASLFQAVYNWIESGEFRIGGITVMGGLIGGAATFLLIYFVGGKLYFKNKQKDFQKKYFNDIFLVAPICISIAHAFGRLGCLMAGCCHGEYLGRTPTVGGIWMNGTTYGWGYYVPTQLYEAIFLFALTAVLSVLYFKRSNIIMSIYLISYGVWRMIIEFFRDDHVGKLIPGLSPSQWQSIVFITLGVAILIYYKVKKLPFVLPKTSGENKDK